MIKGPRNREIFKPNFLELHMSEFSKIFRDRTGVDPLSTCKLLGKSLFTI